MSTPGAPRFQKDARVWPHRLSGAWRGGRVTEVDLSLTPPLYQVKGEDGIVHDAEVSRLLPRNKGAEAPARGPPRQPDPVRTTGGNQNFEKSALVWYRRRSGTYRAGRVMQVCRDVNPPHYLVVTEGDGAEHDTVAPRLLPRAPGDVPPAPCRPPQIPAVQPARTAGDQMFEQNARVWYNKSSGTWRAGRVTQVDTSVEPPIYQVKDDDGIVRDAHAPRLRPMVPGGAAPLPGAPRTPDPVRPTGGAQAFDKGALVWYRRRSGTHRSGTHRAGRVLQVFHDGVPPHYLVEMEADGSTRDTEADRLMPRTPKEKAPFP